MTSATNDRRFLARRRVWEAVRGRGTGAEALEGRVLLANIYVDGDWTGLHSGASWDTALTDLQEALGLAKEGDRILVAGGTYKPTSTTDRSISFVLRDGVSILGGFAGAGAADPDARDTVRHATILSGEVSDAPGERYATETIYDDLGDGSARWGRGWGYNGRNNGNSVHVVTGYGVGRTAVLDGVTITGGRADVIESPGFRGGGMYLWAASPTLINVTFSDNVAISHGGGLAAYGNSSPVLRDCTFTQNRNCAVVLACSAATMTGVTFYENNGTIENYRSTTTLDRCTFTRNIGLIDSVAGSLTITNSVFQANAGAVGNSSGQMRIENSIFAGNTGDLGSVISNDGDATITNSTLYSNHGLSSESSQIHSSGPLVITNSLIWGDGAPFSRSTLFFNTVQASYSNIRGGFPGAGNIDVEPRVVRAPWTGADGAFAPIRYGNDDPPSSPFMDGDDYGDLRLRPDSPLLNAGSNAAVPGGMAVDLDGRPRIQGGTVAIGAYETPTAAPAARTLYVDQNAPAGGSGSSWADAFTHPQQAIEAARDGDTILVADGVYRTSSTDQRDESFSLRNNVRMLGGYAGYGAANPNARDIAVYRTTLSGEIGTSAVADNALNVVLAYGVETSTVLDGFTITGGFAHSGATDFLPMQRDYGSGAGVYVLFADPVLRNLTIADNVCDVKGAGMYVYRGSPAISNITFSGHYAVFSHINEPERAEGSGATLYIEEADVAPDGCTFIRNDHAALEALNATVTVTNSSFIRNRGHFTGGIATDSSRVRLLNVAFLGNTAKMGNAIVFGYLESAVNCIFVGNSGFRLFGDVGTLTNCTIVGTDVVDQTVLVTPANRSLATNCIVRGARFTQFAELYPLMVAYSNVEGGFPGIGNIDAEPQFVRDPSPGADGVWGSDDDDYGDLRLRPTSPGIDAGNNAAAGLAGVMADLGGGARFVDVAAVADTGSGTAPLVDMGAYENGPAVSLSGNTVRAYQNPGTIVGTLSAEDPSTGLPVGLNCTLVAGHPDNAAFTLSGGTLYTAAVLNDTVKSTYQVCIRATGGGWSFEQVFAITVTPANTAPVAPDLQVTAAEDLPVGSMVGIVQGSDADGDGLTYSIVSGNEAGLFSVDPANGRLTLAAALDYETATEHALTVRVSDSGTPSMSTLAAVRISVADVREKQPFTVNGTAGANVIQVGVVGDRYVIMVDGVSTESPISDTGMISIAAGAGDDMIAVDAAVTIPCSIIGQGGNDTILASSGADTIYGGDGNDLVYGNGGNDSLYGNFGDDSLYAGAGDDSLMGGLGRDSLLGGADNDELHGGDGQDWLYGNAGDDLLMGKGKADSLYGGTGNDTIIGGAGADRIEGGAGSNQIDSRDNYEINGVASAFSDTLVGVGATDMVLHDEQDVIEAAVATILA